MLGVAAALTLCLGDLVSELTVLIGNPFLCFGLFSQDRHEANFSSVNSSCCGAGPPQRASRSHHHDERESPGWTVPPALSEAMQSVGKPYCRAPVCPCQRLVLSASRRTSGGPNRSWTIAFIRSPLALTSSLPARSAAQG